MRGLEGKLNQKDIDEIISAANDYYNKGLGIIEAVEKAVEEYKKKHGW